MERLTRRRFLKRSLGFAGAALGLRSIARSGEDPKGPKVRPDVIVYRGEYPGWPWVARAGGEKLVCVFRDDGVHDFSPTGKVLFTASADGGKTWSPARPIADEPDVDDRNAAIARFPDGRLAVAYNTYDRDRTSRPKIVFSRDDGATWSEPTAIADLDARTRAAPVPLSSGEILLPIYRAPGNGAIAALSADGGKTWALAPVPDAPGFLGDEWTVVEVERGRLVGILRNNGAADGFFWKTESANGGRVWEKPVKTNVRDARSTSPAHLDWHGKTPVLTYADRRMVSVSMVATRDPEFREWDLERRVLCYQYAADGSAIPDGSYPVSVAGGDRLRFIVDYEIRPEGRWIAGYFVEVPEDWR